MYGVSRHIFYNRDQYMYIEGVRDQYMYIKGVRDQYMYIKGVRDQYMYIKGVRGIKFVEVSYHLDPFKQNLFN